jgi:hypothetical protein
MPFVERKRNCVVLDRLPGHRTTDGTRLHRGLDAEPGLTVQVGCLPCEVGNSREFKLKLHLFDLLWICCTTSCTANPQQIHNISTCENVVDLLWTLVSTANPQQIETVRS